MIQVSISCGSSGGDTCMSYLIDTPTEGYKDYFTAGPNIAAIRRALSEFERKHPNWRISGIGISTTPDKVLTL